MTRLSHRLIGLWPMPKLLFIIFLLLLPFISPSPAQAEPKEFVKAVQEGNNLQWYLGGRSGMLATTADSLLVAITGAYDEQGNLISGGALQGTSILMASLYQKPASSVQYLAYVFNHSGLAKSAYAQGKGWSFLTDTKIGGTSNSVILTLWTTSRNVVYLLFIVIFVAIGFMIMFRSKLNPQTIVNLQLALPNIIVSLILVTFSFAICGFIIDFAYLGHKLIEAVFFLPVDPRLKPLSAVVSPSTYSDIVEKVDIITALLYPKPGGPITSPWEGINVFSQFGDFIQKLGEKFLEMVGGTASNFFTSLVPLIFAFTLLGTALKILFALLTKYVSLILSTIFSPFVFLFTAFPGKSEGTSNFLKTILSAALAFPATAFMFFLSAFFVKKSIGLELNSLPPLNKEGILAESASIWGGGGIDRVFEPLIALGILMAATQVSQAIDQMLGVKPGIAGAATPDVGNALRKIPIIGSLLG